MKNNKLLRGFSLIEVLMVIAIIAVLSGAGAWIMVYTVKNSVFIPNQLNMDKLANDALNIMITGDKQASGLRFSRSITAIAANQVNFINQDGAAIIYRLDTGTNKLYRKIDAAAEINLPFYANIGNIAISGPTASPTTIFTYYDSAEISTAVAADVRRIQIILVAKSGTGSYNDWEGSSEQITSIAVDKLQ